MSHEVTWRSGAGGNDRETRVALTRRSSLTAVSLYTSLLLIGHSKISVWNNLERILNCGLRNTVNHSKTHEQIALEGKSVEKGKSAAKGKSAYGCFFGSTSALFKQSSVRECSRSRIACLSSSIELIERPSY